MSLKVMFRGLRSTFRGFEHLTDAELAPFIHGLRDIDSENRRFIEIQSRLWGRQQ